jgi:hypothetical protein
MSSEKEVRRKRWMKTSIQTETFNGSKSQSMLIPPNKMYMDEVMEMTNT